MARRDNPGKGSLSFESRKGLSLISLGSLALQFCLNTTEIVAVIEIPNSHNVSRYMLTRRDTM